MPQRVGTNSHSMDSSSAATAFQLLLNTRRWCGDELSTKNNPGQQRSQFWPRNAIRLLCLGSDRVPRVPSHPCPELEGYSLESTYPVMGEGGGGWWGGGGGEGESQTFGHPNQYPRLGSPLSKPETCKCGPLSGWPSSAFDRDSNAGSMIFSSSLFHRLPGTRRHQRSRDRNSEEASKSVERTE